MDKIKKPQRTRKTAIAAWILVVSMLMQTLALCGFAQTGVTDLLGNTTGKLNSGLNGVSSSIATLNNPEALAALKQELLKDINKDLLYQVAEQQLTGEVGVILTFSGNDLVSNYTSSNYEMTFEEYRASDAMKALKAELTAKQDKILDRMLGSGLISEVKYQYTNILDGAYVKTTYEQLEQIVNTEGVVRVTISNTYEAAAAVENPVNVYDTGIFNSTDVEYTGKGTLVAILDTGLDYTHSAFTTHQVVDPAYDRTYVEGLLEQTEAYKTTPGMEAREVYYGNITKDKVVFGYDYADKDPDIMPFNNLHGTHVAGIIGGYDETITGVAVDTQFAIMKVFSDYQAGGNDGDILAALEDCVTLGVDAINMSLGSSSGFSRESDDDYKNDLYDRIEAAGISLIVAASNDYSSAMGSVHGNTNKASNPDSATVGTPSTFKSALSVASINGNMDEFMLANGDQEVFFNQSVDTSAEEYDFFEMLGIKEGEAREFEYVTVPGYGMAINYSSVDVAGKIALVRRGEITFEEKIQFAYEAGAIAVIIYNNVFGEIMMTVGNNAKIPAVSIGKDEGEVMAARPNGVIEFDWDNKAGPFMSDFSSWGPTPDLKLKPEITAHGGNILSAVPGGKYEEMSGTSMAAPNMCGIVVLIRQHIKEAYPELTTPEVRDMVNQLCMSTATIALDRHGNPYSPRKQGAGIADILKATTTPAYLYVDGIDKTKLELGDDPERTGVYTMSMNLKNLSNEAVSYKIGNITMTESLSTSDPEFVAEIGYLLSNTSEYAVENGTLENGIVTVAAGQTAKITVTLTLSDADKAYMNAGFKNGIYVEGFITFDNTKADGIDLNAPFLGFYGDWSEAPIFDLDYYEVETESHNNAIDDEDKIKADYYATVPLGTYYYDYILPLGSYVYAMDPDDVAIPATRDKAAISYYADCISGIFGVYAGLLRGAKEMNIEIINKTTGEVVWSETKFDCYKSHYYGGPSPYFAKMDVPMVNYTSGEVFGYNNAEFVVNMSARLDWEGGQRNTNDTYSFSFHVDYEAPTITDAVFRTEYDKGQKRDRYYVDMMVYDNQYAMSLRPVVLYENVEEDGEVSKVYSALAEYPTPVYQDKAGQATKVSIEITDYMDQIRNSAMPEGITIYLDDYAMNSGVCFIPFPETENFEMDFMTSELELGINQTYDLTTYLVDADNNPVNSDYLQSLTWASSDESVVAIHNGKIEAKSSGTATITVTGDTWVMKNMVAGQPVETQLYKTLVITVNDTIVDDPNSSGKAQIEKLEFSHFQTIFAFNSDIDYSEIGASGDTKYFGGNYNIACYPSEQFQLFYSLEPWNLDPERYELKWTSSNTRVATVDENGVVTAQAEGKARITLQITVDGKTSLLAARCAVEVKSEFVSNGRTLVAYKGWGGDVVVPEGEGIVTIGAFAFSHYDFDSEKEVEKDEDGNYDIDDKKTPIGNKTVTSVTLPHFIETIEKYAFYGCEVLESVTLPETCEIISEFAFYGCKVLTDINLENVNIVSNAAFYNCVSLNGANLGGLDTSSISVIGDYAFYGTRVENLDLTNLSRSGKGAFMNCSKLTSVELGTKTRIAPSMFENTALKSVELYCDTIPDRAFYNCQSLTNVVIHGDLTYLGAEAFSDCKKLATVTFEGECEEIATSAFSGCKKLEEITLPNGEVMLRDAVFANSGLKKLVFGEKTTLKAVGINCFTGLNNLAFEAPENSNYVVKDGIVYSADEKTLVFVRPDANMTTFEVPAYIEVIGDGAFSGNRKLTTVTFAENSNLKQIGYGAFSGMTQLHTVVLPDRDITIGGMAFAQSSKLKNINLDKINAVGDFAFNATGLTDVNLPANGVTIGFGAFYECVSLKTVTLGAAAKIGEYAFYGTNVETVSLLGEGVTVAEGAFSACTSLTSFDFEKLTGKVGDYAFSYCYYLTSVNMPHVTEIGMAAFGDCVYLSEFSAEKLEVIGNNAFSIISEEAQCGATFETIYVPNLRVVGDYAFYACVLLKEIDLTNVEKVGEAAFAACQSMETVIMGENVHELPAYTFYYCFALTDIDLQYVKEIGMGAFYGVVIPEHLELTNVERIEDQAFAVGQDDTTGQAFENYLVSVNAPNLKYVGSMTFMGCLDLREINAPVLETIGNYAFAYTAIEEFEVSANLKKMDYSVFEGSAADGTANLTAFYVMVDGEKVYDYECDTIMLKDGVLYTVVKNGYILTAYPNAKTDAEYTVADNTVRIEFTAAMNNPYLEKIIMPESLRSIGNYAFYGCTSLETVVFNSYYAPVLEGTASGMEIEITPDSVENYPGFETLYKYDYYYRYLDVVAMPKYYFNFVGAVGSIEADNLTFILPDECEGYDGLLYKAYFKPSEETSGKTIGKYAYAFIEAAKKLPDVASRYDKAVVTDAINAYNALQSHTDELAMVSEDLINHFNRACVEYNVSVAENKINHLFDLDRSEYSFEIVKDARAFFNGLTAEEKALVSNADKLNAKIEELKAVMGKDVDFTKTFDEHFPSADPGIQPDETQPTQPDKGGEKTDGSNNTVLIVVIAVVVVAGIAAGVVVFLKKKKPETNN